jgi:hypothetical protein
MLGDAYDEGREQRGQVKSDVKRGKDRAQRVKAEAETRTGAGNGDVDVSAGVSTS